jgi:hypothetical protein
MAAPAEDRMPELVDHRLEMVAIHGASQRPQFALFQMDVILGSVPLIDKKWPRKITAGPWLD